MKQFPHVDITSTKTTVFPSQLLSSYFDDQLLKQDRKNDSVRQKLHINKTQGQKPNIRKIESWNKKKNASTHNELLAKRLSKRKQITEQRKKEEKC